MKILGIDYGSKNIGIALSDDEHRQAFLYDTLDGAAFHEQLQKIISDEDVASIVVGLPLSMDGSEGPKAKTVRGFARQLHKTSKLPIHFEDERLTTKMAERFTRQKGLGLNDHQLAAREILQSYLDKQQG